MLVDGEVVMTREEIFDGSDSSKISFLEKSDNGFRRYFGYKAPTIIVDNGLVPEIEFMKVEYDGEQPVYRMDWKDLVTLLESPVRKKLRLK